MSDAMVYVAIDVGMGNHEVCLEDAEGEQERWQMDHRHDAFWSFQSRLLEATGGKLETVTVGIEGHNGHLCPLDKYLVDWGCDVKNVDARKLKAFRDTFGVPCKTDGKDAELILHVLKQDRQLWNQGKAPYHDVGRLGESRRKLKKWARYQKTLVEEKTRKMNRLTKWVHEICPELLDVAKLKGTRMLRLLRKYPSVRGLKQVTRKGLESIQQVGSQTAKRFQKALKNLEYDSEMVDVYTPMIEQTTTRILELKQQIQDLDEKLESTADSIDAVDYLMSMKGCAIKTASRLIGEIGRIEWYESHNELAAYLGVACVDHQSGDQDGARPVYPSNTIGKDSMMQLAEKMIQHDPESKSYYDRKRNEGKKHNDAVRRVARQVVKIIYRMLEEQRKYVPYSKHEQEGKAA
jgi:transposase